MHNDTNIEYGRKVSFMHREGYLFMVESRMTPQQPSPYRCETCENEECRYYCPSTALGDTEMREVLGGHKFTAKYGCFSHSAIQQQGQQEYRFKDALEAVKELQAYPLNSHEIICLNAIKEALHSRPVHEQQASLKDSGFNEQEQCPHWKSTANLKSDFRDQDLGRFYCSKGEQR
jgi:hypothetical protein